jgi:hypothetical protein
MWHAIIWGQEGAMTEIEAKSYRYLRFTIVILLLGIGVAVFYQTSRQNFELLGSISAYYYTPAQAIFVGSLIGVGACMIALKGITEFEDVVLNIGGMFAPVVALIPTSRGQDYETAVRACRQSAGPLLTQQASGGLDCPTVQALQEAARANVSNGMFAVLILGLLGLLITVAFWITDQRRNRGPVRQNYLWGFGISFVIWALGWVALTRNRDWLVDHGHAIGAIGLFLCMFLVTVSNALRRTGRQLVAGSWWRRTMDAIRAGLGTLVHWPLSAYAWVAWLMIGGIAVAGGLFLGDVVTLFWLEVVVALLFIAFWVVQTIELLGVEYGPRPAPPVEAPPVVGASA